MTSDVIIDQCLLGIGEADTTSPVELSRVNCLALMNHLYQNIIGPDLKILATYSYDGSDGSHTITAGVGTLPSDFLQMAQVYDGDAVSNVPLEQIYEVQEKVGNTAGTTQYMLPDTTTLWIFGKTPTNTVKIYYYKKPTALTDSSASSPSQMKAEYHLDVFVAYIKYVYAMRQNNTYDAIDMMAMVEDCLSAIKKGHGAGKKDNAVSTIVDMYGCAGGV